ncbi:unnamed protein product, partial [Staurois parvus]
MQKNLLLSPTYSFGPAVSCFHRQSSLPGAGILSVGLQSLVISCTVSTVSGHLLYCVRSLWSSLYYVRSLWSSPVLCLQCLVISCTVSAVSGHLLYYVCTVLCPQSLVISCTMSAVSGHLLYCVRSLWSHVLCTQSLVILYCVLQSLVISCTMSAVSVISCTVSAVSVHLLYGVRS